MGATMPFSKLDQDPEHIDAMHEAFRRVCDILQLQCSREDPLTDLVVMKIMELAKAGERDPEVLYIDTLRQVCWLQATAISCEAMPITREVA
jgi:hypothetical protein